MKPPRWLKCSGPFGMRMEIRRYALPFLAWRAGCESGGSFPTCVLAFFLGCWWAVRGKRIILNVTLTGKQEGSSDNDVPE